MSEQKTIYETSTIAELNNGIILSAFESHKKVRETYQSEKELEDEMIQDLISQGYERAPIHTPDELYDNLRKQIENLNKITFTDSEWNRFLAEYLDCKNEGLIEKTRKIQENHIYDFKFDSGELKNIKILDKQNINNNKVQVINQMRQKGVHTNRYDVTVLVNGLPLVHIELKRRGVNMREAFEQIHRYSRETFNLDSSLYQYVQIFVISNGTYTRYFANTTLGSKNNYEFTCEWADAKNNVIRDLKDFTATFFAKNTILQLITKYCVFDSNNILLIMRPYQIAATERILWKIESSYQNKKAGSIEAGGFVWHTTGSGKTLTSFKTARLATGLPYIDKVFFVVDRKDLDYQTMKEYKKFQEDSVNGSKDTKELKRSIEKDDNKIVVTTIQKLNEFVKTNKNHPIYDKHCVLIYDECHRSQFGDAQNNIKRTFKNYYQFGFTGTPIFKENSLDTRTTVDIFGVQLHSYIITDAIRDGKVLKFKVDYNNINPQFKSAENEKDEKTLQKMEKEFLMHPDRITKITEHILKTFDAKTRRNENYSLKDRRLSGFNAMFAVQSVEAAKLYYQEFKKQQMSLSEDKRLKVATIYSFVANEETSMKGDIPDENFSPEAMDSTAKEFLDSVIADYNATFRTNFSTAGNEFQNYYKDLSKKVKNKEIDLLIVVGMFLTGFDAPTLNTLFVDKNLRYHGLIQAYSRTNRILNKVKAFGNIVCFRNLEQATKDAISTFGSEQSIQVILEKSYAQYMNGYEDEESGEVFRGYVELCEEIMERFEDPTQVQLPSEKKKFVELFGEIIKRENILKNFDEFYESERIIPQGHMQDLKSAYIKFVEEMKQPKDEKEDKPSIDFEDIEFQIDLLKTDEINLEYILSLIFEKAKETDNLELIKKEVRRIIRSSLGTRAKEDLVIGFLDTADLKSFEELGDIIEAFYTYARTEKNNKVNELITEEKLDDNKSKVFLEKSINRGYVDLSGSEIDEMLPAVSRRGGARMKKKETVFQKMKKLVDVFIGI